MDVNTDLNLGEMSQLSIHSSDSEDWDRSLMLEDQRSQSSSMESSQYKSHHTPRNSVAFPGDSNSTPKASESQGRAQGQRTLSELLKLHAEKGTDCTFSPAEASRLGDVLGEWVRFLQSSEASIPS